MRSRKKNSETIQRANNTIMKLTNKPQVNDYEKSRSDIQDLTFKSAQAFFKSRKKQLSKSEMKSLGLIGSDDLYTNLALLFSDQCPFSIKLAVFTNDESTQEEIFVDRAEFSGSIFEQLEKSDHWLSLHNKPSATFEGRDHQDYPARALREALVNAVAHRDYSLNGPILINIFEDKIEFISVGALVNDLALDDMMLGVSRPRNVNLSSAFIKLGLAEGWGSGIRNIKKQYENNASQPQFLISTHAVKVVLPKLKEKSSQKLSASESKIVEYLQSHGIVNRATLQELLGLSQSSVINILRGLIEKEILLAEKDGRKVNYKLTKTR